MTFQEFLHKLVADNPRQSNITLINPSQETSDKTDK